MLHQHRFCIDKENRNLKLQISSLKFVLLRLYEYFLENVEKKKFSVGGMGGAGLSGYSKHT